jgi:hypothetical protein
MAEKAPKLRGHIEDGELTIDEDVLLDADAAAALRDLEAALANDAEVVGFNLEDGIIINPPEVSVGVGGVPVSVDVGPMDIMVMGPMVGMMMTIVEP